MKILFACGGTAGHINPALAIASQLQSQHPEAEILFVGNPNRMEAELVPKAGFDFAPILVEGFQRRLTLTNIKRNFKALWYLFRSGARAREIIEDFQPDLVLGTGGYVSGPVLRKAAKMGYPTLTHESNAYPGLTTRFLVKYVDRVLLSVEKAKEYLPKDLDYRITGTPVRQELLCVDRTQARERLGVKDRACIVSLGGSTGAARINEAMAAVMGHMQPTKKTHHIHAAGQYGVEVMPKLLARHGVDTHDSHIDVREYIFDMDQCFAAADLVVCRSGAITLAELQAVGRAAILIPSPNVTENHQYINALAMSEKNAAIVIEEKDLTGQGLTKIVEELVDDRQELQNLSQNAKAMGITDGTQRILHEIYDLLEESK